MPSGLDHFNPGLPSRRILAYEIAVNLLRLIGTLFFRFRVWGRHHVPDSGPLLVVSNHQSHLDPMLVGMSIRRRHLNFAARSTLFAFKPFGWLITTFNAHPLKQGESDTAAIRAYIDMLKQGRMVLVFPEGSRTPDGSIHAFKRGAWLLMSRAKCTVLPVAIEGAFDTFPKGTSFPSVFNRRLAVQIGRAIPAAELLAMSPDAGLLFLQQTIEGLRQQAADKMLRAGYQVSTKPAVASDADEPTLAGA